MEGAETLASAMAFNPNKAGEYGRAARAERGATVEPPDASATGSTLTETVPSTKVGTGKPKLGTNAGNLSLDRVRADSTGQRLTTN